MCVPIIVTITKATVLCTKNLKEVIECAVSASYGKWFHTETVLSAKED